MEFLVFSVLALIGIVIHIGSKFVNALTKKSKKLTYKEFFKSYDWVTPVATSIVSLLMAIALIAIRDDLATSIGFMVTKSSALVMGYISDSIWKNLQTKWTSAN